MKMNFGHKSPRAIEHTKQTLQEAARRKLQKPTRSVKKLPSASGKKRFGKSELLGPTKEHTDGYAPAKREATLGGIAKARAAKFPTKV